MLFQASIRQSLPQQQPVGTTNSIAANRVISINARAFVGLFDIILITFCQNYNSNMNSTTLSSSMPRQKQAQQTSDLLRSFKATTNLAQALTKERVHIQHDLQKISAGKDQLEELKRIKKVKEPMLTPEERASKVNKQEIKGTGNFLLFKGTGFNLQMVCSEKGRAMIEAQRDSRRQRHLEALKEAEKYVEQFYESFTERNQEIQDRTKGFLASSDVEIDKIMAGLTDELLLSNEIAYVNGVWEKVANHRQTRKEELQHLRLSFDDLKTFEKKGSGGYLDSMRANLINIAFYLEPEVDKLLADWVSKEAERYRVEHLQNDEFHMTIVQAESEKFEVLYQQWKASVARFHWLKQEDAIEKFLSRMESKEFVNPSSRIQLFQQLKQKQLSVFNQRMDLISQLDSQKTASLTKDFVNQVDDRLKQVNEDAQAAFDQMVQDLNKDMENTNEDMDIAVADLKDLLQKNDAQLEEGQTFDTIIQERALPNVDRRKLEAKTLVLATVKYLDDFDYRMNELCTNMCNFFRELANKLDTNKEKLRQTEMTFQVTLAQCGDSSDERVQAQEDDLEAKVEEMRRAIHHVELNEKLQQCFDMLDAITRSYRDYNIEYIGLVEAYPNTVQQFYLDFERECMACFRLLDVSKREQVIALFTKETEERQKKLEEEALKKYEEEKKAEEAKKAEEEKNKPSGPAKGKAPPPQQKGKGKEPEKPLIDVPKLHFPIQEYQAISGNMYLVERSMDEIATKLFEPQQEEEAQTENKQEAPQQNQNTPQVAQIQASTSSLPLSEPVQPPSEQPMFKENDFLTKASLLPPQDPDGTETINQDMIITKEEVMRILVSARDRCLEWMASEKTNYLRKVQREAKELIDKNVDELDENLRKQWPRKGKLEVEVYQERKSQITAHNKKYERQVRTCLDKFNLLEEQWEYLLETAEKDFANHQSSQDKLRGQLPDGKNLAELQGVSRKEKDSCQTFEERCRDMQDKLHDIALTQADILVAQNNEMLDQCQLFEKGGNYSKDEVEWYRKQMQEINEMVIKAKQERDQKLKQVHDKMEKLMKEPYEKFEKDYKGSIHSLSAKEGLGKTFGQPRRLAQEKLRSEMTKCETAQKGIDQLFEKLQQLCAKSKQDYSDAHDYLKEKKSLSLEIRATMISLMRCIVHYGTHLNGFSKEPRQMPRLTHSERQAEVDLQSSEQGATDDKRKDEEVEPLGPLGFKNAAQLKYPEMVIQIEKQSKEMCVKLYTGELAKYLVGTEKIPEYLTVFMEGMRNQAEGFRIGSVRQLRETALKLVEFCQEIPQALLGYLNRKYTSLIAKDLGAEDKAFKNLKKIDDENKEKHLKLFRPNLENPANKAITMELNQKESDRTEKFKELIDDTQLKMLDIEQDLSMEFHVAFLNNVKVLIRLYDSLLYKEDFIMLPGDEIIEKKHQNIKMLTAQAMKQDLSKSKTRKWLGLGACIFEIDFATMFDHFKDLKTDEPQQQQQPPPTNDKQAQQQQLLMQQQAQNEVCNDCEIANTNHHKTIMKARNEFYTQFKQRFEQSTRSIMEKFDSLRKEELRFNSYWAQNLKEITQKHI